jgi:hypothetical protein
MNIRYLGGRVVATAFWLTHPANLFSKNKLVNTRISVCTFTFFMILFASIGSLVAQERSQDRDNPTLIDGKGIEDKLDGSGDEYFYQFTMGKGKLSILFKVTASSTSAGATLDLFDADSSRPILSNVLVQGVDGGSDQTTKSVQLDQQRNVIIMRIKGIRYGDSGGTGTYVVGIEGPAASPQVEKAAGPAVPLPRFDGELDGTDNLLSHAFSVKGPGKVTLKFDVKASGTNAGAYFELVDGNGREILSNVLVQAIDNGSERISKSVNFGKPQVVILRIKGIRYGSSGGRGVYSVQIDGPVATIKQD